MEKDQLDLIKDFYYEIFDGESLHLPNYFLDNVARGIGIKKLNAWVGTIAGSYVIPEQAVRKLRESLSKIGLTFDTVPVMEGQSGSFELPLTLFGGRFGKDVDTEYDEFVNDDGISHQKEGGLALVLNYEMNEDNSCRLTASIK